MGVVVIRRSFRDRDARVGEEGGRRHQEEVLLKGRRGIKEGRSLSEEGDVVGWT